MPNKSEFYKLDFFGQNFFFYFSLEPPFIENTTKVNIVNVAFMFNNTKTDESYLLNFIVKVALSP